MKLFMAGYFAEGWFVTCISPKHNVSIIVKEGLDEETAKTLADKLNALVED